MTAIRWQDVGVAYDAEDLSSPEAVADVSFEVEPGEVALLVGPSGSGKSTLLRTTNGLVPHSSGGRFRGDVEVFGRSTRTHRPRDLADVVGFVHQDPEAQFVVDRVEHDVAFALENLGMDATAMRRRVEEVLDALGIAHLRGRSPGTLSGGEKQRAALAGALAAAPAALVLDEPTAMLDPQGADDVMAALARLNADLGTTVLLTEHRLERAAPLADRAFRLEAGRIVHEGAPAEVVVDYPGAPTVTRLGRLLGWDPLPLTVRDARAAARRVPGPTTPPLRAGAGLATAAAPGDVLLEVQGAAVALGGRTVLGGVDLQVRAGEVVAVLGRNGAGKTTLLRTLGGLQEPDRGRRLAHAGVGLVPQDPSGLLSAATVRDELELTLRLRRIDDGGRVDRWLHRLGIDHLAERSPRSLSSGERQRVAVAAIAVAEPAVLLLDEPTRGIDAPSADALERALAELAAEGRGAVLATHDVELAARCATRALVLAEGDVVADGDAHEVLAGSLFAPQVLRVLPPYLTVDEVAAALVADESR
jgi:energy-coupling factor transport system ATP-binding protein